MAYQDIPGWLVLILVKSLQLSPIFTYMCVDLGYPGISAFLHTTAESLLSQDILEFQQDILGHPRISGVPGHVPFVLGHSGIWPLDN